MAAAAKQPAQNDVVLSLRIPQVLLTEFERAWRVGNRKNKTEAIKEAIQAWIAAQKNGRK